MILYKDDQKTLWMAADTPEEASKAMESYLKTHSCPSEIEAIVRLGDSNIIHILRAPNDIREFIHPSAPGVRLSEMLIEAEAYPVPYEIIIYAKHEDQFCFNWGAEYLALWKLFLVETDYTEYDLRSQLQNFTQTDIESITGLLLTSINGINTRFIMATIADKVPIEEAIWVSPKELSGFTLEPNLQSLLASSSILSQMIHKK